MALPPRLAADVPVPLNRLPSDFAASPASLSVTDFSMSSNFWPLVLELANACVIVLAKTLAALLRSTVLLFSVSTRASAVCRSLVSLMAGLVGKLLHQFVEPAARDRRRHGAAPRRHRAGEL